MTEMAVLRLVNFDNAMVLFFIIIVIIAIYVFHNVSYEEGETENDDNSNNY